MNRGKKILGIVVLFNPPERIVDNIKSYNRQVDKLIAFDNSVSDNEELKTKLQQLENLIYYSNKKNNGIAAALNYGAKKASEWDYEFLLTMDQDSRASENLVGKLLDYALKFENLGIISPYHKNKFGTITHLNEEYSQKTAVKTSGNLISIDSFKSIGKFREDYFIDYVDIEYCFRLIQNNYKAIQVNSIYLDHEEADMKQINLFFRKVYPYNHSPFRYYYKTRNLCYLIKEYKNVAPKLLKLEKREYKATVMKMLLFERKK